MALNCALSSSKVLAGSSMAKSNWILSIPVMAVVIPLTLHMQCHAKMAALSPNGMRHQNRSEYHSPSWLVDNAVLATNLKSSMVAALLPLLAQPWRTCPHPTLPCLLMRRHMATSLLKGFGRRTKHASLMCTSPMITQSCTRGRNRQ